MTSGLHVGASCAPCLEQTEDQHEEPIYIVSEHTRLKKNAKLDRALCHSKRDEVQTIINKHLINAALIDLSFFGIDLV